MPLSCNFQTLQLHVYNHKTLLFSSLATWHLTNFGILQLSIPAFFKTCNSQTLSLCTFSSMEIFYLLFSNLLDLLNEWLYVLFSPTTKNQSFKTQSFLSCNFQTLQLSNLATFKRCNIQTLQHSNLATFKYWCFQNPITFPGAEFTNEKGKSWLYVVGWVTWVMGVVFLSFLAWLVPNWYYFGLMIPLSNLLIIPFIW